MWTLFILGGADEPSLATLVPATAVLHSSRVKNTLRAPLRGHGVTPTSTSGSTGSEAATGHISGKTEPRFVLGASLSAKVF